MRADRATHYRVGGTVYSDQWGAYRRRDMHGATVTRNDQVGTLEQGCQLCQACLTCHIDWLFMCATQDSLNERQIVRCSCQNNGHAIFADKPVDQLGPVRNGPAFGLPVSGTAVAGNDRSIGLYTFPQQYFIYLLVCLRIDMQSWSAILRCDSNSCCLRQFQAIIDLVQVIVGVPVCSCHAVSHKSWIALLSKANTPLCTTENCQYRSPGAKDTYCKIIVPRSQTAS